VGVASIPESAAALVAHVDNAELAAWLLNHAKLSSPMKLQVALSGPEAVRHLKGDVTRAVTAAMSCDDLDALDRFARDSRVTIKRVVAAKSQLLPDTVERLWAYAHKHNDSEIFGGLVDKVSLDVLSAQLRSATSHETVALLSSMAHDRSQVLAERLVAAGDWGLFSLAAAGSRRYGGSFALALAARAVDAEGLEFSDPSSPLNNAASESAVRLPLETLVRGVRHWDRQRAEWAVKLYHDQFAPAPSASIYEVSPYGYHHNAGYVRDEVAVDDDAADILVGVLDRSVDSLAHLRSRNRTYGAAAALLRRELTSAVSSNPRQASRHFDRLLASGEEDVAITLIWRASAHRRTLTVQRERALLELAASSDLVASTEGLPPLLGRRVDSDVLLTLLRSGELGVTLEWLSGRRFCPPTPELVAELVADPGKAFFQSRYSSQFNKWARLWWTQLPTPSGWRQNAAGSAAAWFIDMLDWKPSGNLATEEAELAYLRRTITPELVAVAVDAASASGVRAALGRPDWLVGRIHQLVGDSLEVWSALVGLAPEWEQSLTELITTAALLSGMSVRTPADVEPASADPARTTPTQLALL
jgi:hypothetical protein